MTVNYHEYMASREWAVKKREVHNRSAGVCERCHHRPASQVHHLTYERIGDESLTDLLDLCKHCHEYLSAKSDTDPAAPLTPEPPQPHDDFSLIKGFAERADKVGIDPSILEMFNADIQAAIRVSHSSTALKLAQIKLEANRKFVKNRESLPKNKCTDVGR